MRKARFLWQNKNPIIVTYILLFVVLFASPINGAHSFCLVGVLEQLLCSGFTIGLIREQMKMKVSTLFK
jgi:hypothetical protein